MQIPQEYQALLDWAHRVWSDDEGPVFIPGDEEEEEEEELSDDSLYLDDNDPPSSEGEM
jgi:hypothetical protein